MHVNTTSSFNVKYRILLYSSNYFDSFIKFSSESYKWTLISEHVFKASITSMHTSSQMATLNRSVDNVLVKVKPSLHQAFLQVVVSWIFLSCTLCCITPKQVNLRHVMTLIHCDEAMIHLMQFSLVVYVAVVVHFRCFDFHKVMQQQ